MSSPPPLPQRPIFGIAAVIINNINQCCLVQRGNPPAAGCWSFPGGKLEYGETIAEGLRREIQEECGIEIDVLDVEPLAVVEKIGTDDPEFPHHYIIADYLCRARDEHLCAGDDAAAAHWVYWEDLDTYLLDSSVAMEVARRAQRRLGLI